ncbi:LytTR family DNA-binding domain-containing protein [Fervidobacterium riparium]|uniref:LytR/AlgR family response regulator transcription factor n=1 Tax=Fervidobacterium gondwanense TaxID=44754 RepID=UPI002202D660|nr:LytTR family transcriptional regulator [Fervidobacterium riparium]
MTCVIVEDEKLLALVLEKMLKEEGLDILGIASHAREAIELIDTKMPDLVFLDINLGEYDGFYVLENIKHRPYVIFTTAYSEYAVRAFEENAIDYLLKPIRKERLRTAIGKAKKIIEGNQEGEIQQSKMREFIKRMKKEKFSVEIDGEVLFLNISKILYIYANEGEVVVVSNEGKLTTKTSLRVCEERLPEEQFLRVHKSYIINVEHITKIIKNYFGSMALELSNGDIVPVGRNYKESLKELLE